MLSKNMNKILYITSQMMKTDLKLFFKRIRAKLIDAIIWGSITLTVIAYIMPMAGLKNFGLFQAGSVIVSVIAFETYNQLFSFVMQIEKREYLFYLFTLPIHTLYVFAQKILLYTLNGTLISLVIVGVSKAILMDQMPLYQIAWMHLFIAIISSAFFFGCFMILLSSFANTISKVEHVFMRVMFPLWFFGGFQFSWKMLYELNAYAGYAALISPYTYATEAVRGAIFNFQGFLNFWICIGMLIILGIGFSLLGYYRLKKKLDLA